MKKAVEEVVCKKCGKTFILITEKLPCKLEEEKVRDTYVLCPYCNEAFSCKEASDEMISAKGKE